MLAAACPRCAREARPIPQRPPRRRWQAAVTPHAAERASPTPTPRQPTPRQPTPRQPAPRQPPRLHARPIRRLPTRPAGGEWPAAPTEPRAVRHSKTRPAPTRHHRPRRCRRGRRRGRWHRGRRRPSRASPPLPSPPGTAAPPRPPPLPDPPSPPLPCRPPHAQTAAAADRHVRCAHRGVCRPAPASGACAPRPRRAAQPAERYAAARAAPRRPPHGPGAPCPGKPFARVAALQGPAALPRRATAAAQPAAAQPATPATPAALRRR